MVAAVAVLTLGAMAKIQAVYAGEHSDARAISVPHAAAPEPKSSCFERRLPCGREAVSPAHGGAFGSEAPASAALIKAAAPPRAFGRRAVPPAAASLSILFRNLRE